MKLLNTIALSAVAAVLVAPATADAKAKRHHAAHAGPSTAAELHEAQEEIGQLQARLTSLEAKIDQQGSTQQATASQAASQAEAATQLASTASAKADQAVVKADAATAAAAHPPIPKALAWASNTQINGRMFFNESTITQKTKGANNANSGTGFNIKRMYFGVDHQFSPIFAGTLLMDISNVVGQTNNQNFNAAGTPGLVGKGFYIKQAFLQAKLDPALVIRVGSAALPWVPYVEGQYGLRHIENTTVDRLSYGTTADWGVHVLGDLAHGLISYQVSAIDGGGYRNVKVTKYVDLEGRLSAQYDGFWAAIGGYTGKRANGVQATVANPTPTFRTAERLNAAAGYKSALFNVGGEYFYAKNWNNVTVNPATNVYSQDSAEGYSLFGNVNVTPKWTVFGRYDWTKPNRLTDPALRDHYFNVGLQWEPVKVVDIALVYKRETAKNGAIATTDGVIGCGTSATANSFSNAAALASGTCTGNGTYDEVGLFGQFKF